MLLKLFSLIPPQEFYLQVKTSYLPEFIYVFFVIIYTEFPYSIGNIYTGLHDGRIVKITKSGGIEDVAHTGERLPECGRVGFYRSELLRVLACFCL